MNGSLDLRFFLDKLHLDDSFSIDELKKALFSMNSFKTPGPDGIQAHFFKHGWMVIQKSISHFVNSVLMNP